MRHLSLSVALVVSPAVAFGQHPVPANLSLADAITLARANNPAYRQTIHDRAPAAWGVRNAYASLLIDRKSTRLNSSHLVISYAVFCLKKKIFICTKSVATAAHPAVRLFTP